MSAFKTQISGGHYLDLAIQPAQFMRANGVPHAEGEAIYHILRHRQKRGLEDLEKAIHWIQLIIDMDYPEESRQERAGDVQEATKPTEALPVSREIVNVDSMAYAEGFSPMETAPRDGRDVELLGKAKNVVVRGHWKQTMHGSRSYVWDGGWGYFQDESFNGWRPIAQESEK